MSPFYIFHVPTATHTYFDTAQAMFDAWNLLSVDEACESIMSTYGEKA